MIHITDDQTDTILTVIDEDDFWSDLHTKKLSGVETFYFETFADRPFSEYLTDRNRVIIPNEDGGYAEFIIEENEQLFDRTKVIHANASYIELKKKKILDPQTFQAQTASQLMEYTLSGTEWKPGTVVYTTLRSITLDEHTDAYQMLRKIASTYEMELVFRVEVSGGKITGRYVDLIERIGSWTGREAVFGTDLIGVKRVEKTDEIVTALIGVGPEDENGNPLEVFVEDLDAKKRWGRNGQHLVAVYQPQSSSQDMTVGELTTLTENELANRINAVVEYESTVANLESVPGLEHHTVRFGDTIRIKDEGFFPPLYLEARIHTQERSIKDDRSKSFVLGDYIEYTEEEVMALFRQLQSQINQAMAKEEIYEGAVAPTDKNQYWIDTTQVPNVLKRWDDANSTWVKATPTTPEEVGAISPEEARDLSEVAKYDGYRITIYREKSSMNDQYTQIIDNPAMYTVAVKTELQNAKAGLDTAYTNLSNDISAMIADDVVTDAEKTDFQTKEDAYRLAVARFESAMVAAQEDIAAGRASDAQQAATDFTETYANKKVTQGTSAPAGAVTGDLWIDTGVTPYVWKRYDGSAWIKATPTRADEVGAETPSGAQAKADAAQAEAEASAKSYTETYAQKKVTMSATAPTSPTVDDLWLDSSVSPNVWKRWDGSAWVKATANAFAELTGTIGADQIAANTITTTMISTAGLDAGVIKTGVLDAGRVRIGSGTTFDANYDPSTKETPSGAQAKANQAETDAKTYADNTYGGTKTLVDGWKFPNTTFIDGGNVYTGTITANAIASRTITANEIATGAITANEIQSGTITTDLISSVGIDAGVLKAGTVITNDIIFEGELRGASGTFSGTLTSSVAVIDSPTSTAYVDFKSTSSGTNGYTRIGGSGDNFYIQRRNPDGSHAYVEKTWVESDLTTFYGNIEQRDRSGGLLFQVDSGSGYFSGGIRTDGYNEFRRNATGSALVAVQDGAGAIAAFIKGNDTMAYIDGDGTLVLKGNLVEGQQGRILFNEDSAQDVQLRYNTFDSTQAPFGLHIERGPGNTQPTNNPYLKVDGKVFSGSQYMDSTGGIARWQRDNSNYIAQSNDQVLFYQGGSVRHAFNLNGTKSGGSVVIDGQNLGMSPIDSPQVLIEYIEFDILLAPEGTKVFLDDQYVKATDNFAVFPNNGTIIEKGDDYFVIAGEGVTDIRIVGERVGYSTAFWEDMSMYEEGGETIVSQPTGL